jgi:pimeloyl-ACP methyl ester carboxylesterase
MKQFTLLFTICLFCIFANAQNVYIPDANFKTELLNNSAINTNSDFEIQTSEASSYTGFLIIGYKNISDLTGISSFPNLTKLFCFGNQLTSLNLNSNLALNELHCSDNLLTNLDVSNNSLLHDLNCDHNNISNLSLGSNTTLSSFSCWHNQLTSLNISANTGLTQLTCSENQLTNLDLSTNIALFGIGCDNNPLLNLNLNNNINLTSLFCDNIQLTNLNLNTNVQLNYLSCKNNLLTSLNLTTNTALADLDCSGNPNLSCIQVSNFATALANPNWIKDVTASYNTYCSPPQTVFIPDANFKSALLGNSSINTNNDSEIQLSEANGFSGNIFAIGLGITDLTGISSFTSLTGLFCYNNQLTSLNLSSNINLQGLICFNNQLTNLDLSWNTALATLECQNNQIINLNLNSNTLLTNVDCRNNQLSTLNLTNCTPLIYMDSRYNPNLSCIQVPNVTVANSYYFKDAIATFNLNCNYNIFPIFINPNINLSNSNLNTGQILNITGTDFTPNGVSNLILTYPNGDVVTIPNISINILGSLSYSIIIDNSYQGGIYKVFAYDVTTSKYSSELMFIVDKPNNSILEIVKPAFANEQINVGETLILNWQDFIAKDITNGFTAFSTKSYKIESSYNNGGSWAVLNNNALFTDCLPNSMNTFFTYDFVPTQTGTCIIKITDNSNLNNFDISLPINVIQSATTNYTTSLQWDKSTTYTRPNPIGLASDGTSRILVKVSKNNPLITNINLIKATISSPENYNSSELLGKIKVATNISTYSLEGNSANAFDITDNAPTQQNDYYFWLVAPDDFAQNETNTLSERKINIRVELQSNLGTDIVYINNITIVRPPLMLVHGLNGSHVSFEGSKYSVNGNTFYFSPASENITQKSNLWKVVRKVELLNYESYDLNAQILLSMYNQGQYHPNTFKGVLREMHKLGFASCRADYVCHSMGGCIARTVINKYPNEYRPSLTSTAYIKNYDSGFINKLITLNTPHNGSPHADILFALVPQNMANLYNPIIGALEYDFGGMFRWNNSVLSYQASNAIKDLRGTLGGIRFSQTNDVRNHLIGGLFTVGNGNSLDNYVSNSIEKLNDFISYLIPSSYIGESNSSKINNYFYQKFSISNFTNHSDLIVSEQSQFPGFFTPSIPNVTSNTISPVSRSIGYSSMHPSITDNIDVGTKVFHLLNTSIASNNFSSTIAPNLASGGDAQYKKSRSLDSIIRYVDTIKCKIITPLVSTNLYVDSTLIVKYKIKDTANLIGIQFQVQGRIYNLPSNFNNENFSVKISPSILGNQLSTLSTIYDSLGFKIFHYDTVNINVKIIDTISSILLTQHSYNVNKNQYLYTSILGVTNKYILNMNIENDTISYTIGNPSVLEYNVPNKSFYTHDTGSTYIIFDYHNLKDTIYVYVSPAFNSSFPLSIGLNLNQVNTSNCTAILSWDISATNEGSIFYIQKSIDGTNYTNISSVLPESNKTHYTYTDANLKHGKNHYRILVKDVDGKDYYSNIQSINSECNLSTTLKVYPNPTLEILNVDLQLNNSYKTVRLKTIDGQILETIKVTTNNIQQIKFNVKGLPNGTYIIVADKRSGDNEVAKFIKE